MTAPTSKEDSWVITLCHGNPKPSFLGVITHILGVKTFIFHGFWGPRVNLEI